MKNCFSILAALFVVLAAKAQPALTPGQYGPRIGTRLTFNFANSTRLDSIGVAPGANQSWVVNLANPFGTATIEVVSPAATDSAAVFPLANYAIRSQVGPFDVTGYGVVTDSGVFELGSASGSLGTDRFQAPYMLTLPTGLGYGQQRIRQYVVDRFNGTTRSQIRQIDTLAYVGYGTLTLNRRQYRDVVLLQVRRGSFSLAGQLQSFSQSLSLYANGLGYPILDIGVRYDPARGNLRGDPSYASNLTIPTGVQPRQAVVQPWPNPAGPSLHLPAGCGAALALIAADGRLYQVPVAGRQADLRALPPGVYRLGQGAGAAAGSRVVKQ